MTFETSFEIQKIKNFSSGERKKIYLDYCIKQDPEYIILDNPRPFRPRI
jgi:molybdate transport system ATP-binding protein